LPLSVGGVLFIENVGNLVCPAAFDLGEKRRVTLLSITEGEDKPLKYPDIFQGADLVLLTKSDLYPHLQVNKQVLKENINRIVPKSHVIDVSSYSGEGMSDWLEWLRAERKAFLESLASQAQLRADMLRKAS
ncbi:MAG: hydrogenase nickel incorporation protein HypB, partial [Acetobacter sp.]|nr:hydrogenase nickel incorporation protein HypB [Acetobacter sp.]